MGERTRTGAGERLAPVGLSAAKLADYAETRWGARGRAWPSATARSLAARCVREAPRERPAPRRAGAERHPARHHAVPDGGRVDARPRHHEPGQSGARLALHARRLSRRLAATMDRLLRARRARR